MCSENSEDTENFFQYPLTFTTEKAVETFDGFGFYSLLIRENLHHRLSLNQNNNAKNNHWYHDLNNRKRKMFGGFQHTYLFFLEHIMALFCPSSLYKKKESAIKRPQEVFVCTPQLFAQPTEVLFHHGQNIPRNKILCSRWETHEEESKKEQNQFVLFG
ncbi:MAG: hypothetical protein UU48_C0002G0014 [Candidatus Uhrbacteria bacterium GW2011_GWF2_41_16]|uniref:Uncharacterized protein n=2 Tax=Candidatus Uhriibacteriota TaxID=1752732 RepID=A0A0G0VC31_9BACT|nr:MAG: hypothetical protein UU31_C0003G0022 [Candidatus Uhrbacteria bacterium GW2011_GWA2_41_10]KKR87295.1 MAG: hypothetical protein UU35_C0004G0068 [Candidatus Uhrbacteria bacterium GW2011_GWC2_41_11]KKR98479.1 MAG: hypothetical protein UU48_C0002G0014 [Candidatus Uhrbacteria bacterium GW2011_GWF2_41_16]